MLLIDRYIILRFLANFATLFLLLFVFATAIDIILNLDKYVDASRLLAGEDSGWIRRALFLLGIMADFQGPRVFQFYAFLHGLVAVGAMAFTLAQMLKHRELVAVMASGVSLYRVAMPFIVAVFGLSVLQLLNQELILPRIAPLLLRDYAQIGQRGVNKFEVRLTPDGSGNLIQAPTFDPQSLVLSAPTILERDERGRTVRRITADSATWSAADQAWLLTGGIAVRRAIGDIAEGDALLTEPVDRFTTDATPEVLMVRRFSGFATMLSLTQIGQMLSMPSVAERERESLLRYRYSRFSSVLVNLLVLALALPTFLLREPANLLRQSILCAATAIPATVGAALGMMMPLPGIPPAVGVFLPVIVLGFMAMFPWTYFKT